MIYHRSDAHEQSLEQDQLYRYDTPTVMILGVAGGNGLEHVDPMRLQAVYDVDINADYLRECQRRYPKLQNVFQPIDADLSGKKIALPKADLVIANLLIEYIGLDRFKEIISEMRLLYVSCIIQKSMEVTFVSDTPYANALECLDDLHRDISETDLTAAMMDSGYQVKLRQETHLPNGKMLCRIDFFDRLCT